MSLATLAAILTALQVGMTLVTEGTAAIEKLRAMLNKAQAENRDLTDEEVAELEATSKMLEAMVRAKAVAASQQED